MPKEQAWIKRAVILAAGEGKRFKPLSDFIPKELVPLGTTPLLGHLLEEISAVGVKEVILVSSRKKESLNRYFRARALELGFVPHLRYQPRVLGTADAVWRIREYLGEEPFFLYYGDDLWISPEGEPPFTRAQQLLWTYLDFGGLAVSLMRVVPEEVSRFGIALVEPEPLQGEVFRLRGIVEKPRVEQAFPPFDPSPFALVSGMILHPEIFYPIQALLDRRKKGEEVYLTAALDRLCQGKIPVLGCVLKGEWLDIGVLENYPAAFERVVQAQKRRGLV